MTESTLKISCSSCRKTIPTPAAVQRPHTAASVPTSRPCLPVPCARDTCRVSKTHSQLRLPHQDDASAGRWRSRFERRTAVPEFRALPSRPARRDQPGRWSPAVQNRSTAGGVNRRVRTGASERAQQTRRRACQRQRRLGRPRPPASVRVRARQARAAETPTRRGPSAGSILHSMPPRSFRSAQHIDAPASHSHHHGMLRRRRGRGANIARFVRELIQHMHRQRAALTMARTRAVCVYSPAGVRALAGCVEPAFLGPALLPRSACRGAELPRSDRTTDATPAVRVQAVGASAVLARMRRISPSALQQAHSAASSTSSSAPVSDPSVTPACAHHA